MDVASLSNSVEFKCVGQTRAYPYTFVKVSYLDLVITIHLE